MLLVEEEGRNRKKEEGLGVVTVTTLQGHIVIILFKLGLGGGERTNIWMGGSIPTPME